MNQIINYSYFGETAALSAAICWSIAVIIFRSASKDLSPFLITALKNSIALLLFIILFLLLDIPLWHSGFENTDYIKIIISGFLGMGLGDVLFIYALSKIGANRVAIINSFEPAVIYFFSIFMLGTILTVNQLIGFIVVITSILIISYEKDSYDIDPQLKKRGMLLQILAVILSSFGIVLIKPVLNKINGDMQLQLWITTFRLVPGFITAWFIFALQNNKIELLNPLKKSKNLWKIILGSGIGTFIALSFWIIGYGYIEKPPIASIIGQTSVIFITILAWVILNEKISKIRLISMGIAIFGVLLITIK
jgi:drug/metabolite transporter (DMT)-like permease